MPFALQKEVPNHKLQIPNNTKIQMTKIPNCFEFVILNL